MDNNVVYNNVIDDVGNKLQRVFSKQRPGDDLAHLLLQVQQVWREKMVRRRVLQVPSERNTTCEADRPLVHDLNVPIKGTEEFESIGARNSLAQTSMQMPIPTSLSAEGGISKWFLAGQVEEGKAPNQLAGNMRPTRLPPFMRHPSGACRPWLHQSPNGADANAAYEPTGKEEPKIKPQAPIKDFLVPSRKRKWEEFMLDFSTNGCVPQAGSGTNASLIEPGGNVLPGWRASKTTKTT